jgi:hypothetical protein
MDKLGIEGIKDILKEIKEEVKSISMQDKPQIYDALSFLKPSKPKKSVEDTGGHDLLKNLDDSINNLNESIKDMDFSNSRHNNLMAVFTSILIVLSFNQANRLKTDPVSEGWFIAFYILLAGLLILIMTFPKWFKSKEIKRKI